MKLKEPKTTTVVIQKEELVPKFFTIIEEALKKEPGTFIFCDPEIVNEFGRRSLKLIDGKYQVEFKSHFGGGDHYYSDDDFEGKRNRVEIYDGPKSRYKMIYAVVFVKNATNCYQIEGFSAPEVGYAHYNGPLNEILIVNYEE